MNYELAKQLKEAGFPQKKHYGPTGIQIDFWSSENAETESEMVAEPTLSELIEACGDGFAELGRTYDYGDKAMWRAYMSDEAFDKTGPSCVRECCGYDLGSTPGEAVAKLWLAINIDKNAKE